MKYLQKHLLFITGLCFFSSALMAGDAEIVHVSIKKSRTQYTFHVTLKHADTGWKHYANGWRVVDSKGKVLGMRVLYHPHVDEQPFTRSHQLKIPAGTSEVYVEARDSVHGWNKTRVRIDLGKNKGDRYEVR